MTENDPTADAPAASKPVARDVFISHAGPDKDSIIRPFVEQLSDRGHSDENLMKNSDQ